jgi:hypothetical protein
MNILKKKNQNYQKNNKEDIISKIKKGKLKEMNYFYFKEKMLII